MGNEVHLTLEGKRKLEAKLEDLTGRGRREVAQKIKHARELGDISENAEYDAAKDEQAMIEAEIKKIEDQLANAVIIGEAAAGGKKIAPDEVAIGRFVQVEEDGEVTEYQIVGSAEADIAENRISNKSPLAAALLGRKKGETVTVRAPQENYQVKILGVRK